MSNEEKVSINARTIILAIIASVAGIAGSMVVLSSIGQQWDAAEKVALATVSGLIGFGAGIVTALWGK